MLGGVGFGRIEVQQPRRFSETAMQWFGARARSVGEKDGDLVCRNVPHAGWFDGIDEGFRARSA